jgi:hypothetical protein
MVGSAHKSGVLQAVLHAASPQLDRPHSHPLSQLVPIHVLRLPSFSLDWNLVVLGYWRWCPCGQITWPVSCTMFSVHGRRYRDTTKDFVQMCDGKDGDALVRDRKPSALVSEKIQLCTRRL